MGQRWIMEGQMGGSPKALRQHLAGETSLLVICLEPRQRNFLKQSVANKSRERREEVLCTPFT